MLDTTAPQQKPAEAPLHDGFDSPQVISDALLAFPGEVRHLMPAYSTIPETFRSLGPNTEWGQFVSHWLFLGNPFSKWDLHLNPDIDGKLAIRHLRAILGSYQPKHEHKEAAVAWLLSRWFSSITRK